MAKNNQAKTHLSNYKWKNIEHDLSLLQQRDRTTKKKLAGTEFLDTINFVDWPTLKKNLRNGVYDEEQAQDVYKLVRQSVKDKDNYFKIQTDKNGEIETIQSANPEKQEIYKAIKDFEEDIQAEQKGIDDFLDAYNGKVQSGGSGSAIKSILQTKDPSRLDSKVRSLYGEDIDYDIDVAPVYESGESRKDSYLRAMSTIIARNMEAGEDYEQIEELYKQLKGKDSTWFHIAYQEGLLPSIQDFYGYIRVPDDTAPDGYRLVPAPTDSTVSEETVMNLWNDDRIKDIDTLTAMAREKAKIKSKYTGKQRKQQYKTIQKKVVKQATKAKHTQRPSVTLHRKYGV